MGCMTTSMGWVRREAIVAVAGRPRHGPEGANCRAGWQGVACRGVRRGLSLRLGHAAVATSAIARLLAPAAAASATPAERGGCPQRIVRGERRLAKALQFRGAWVHGHAVGVHRSPSWGPRFDPFTRGDGIDLTGPNRQAWRTATRGRATSTARTSSCRYAGGDLPAAHRFAALAVDAARRTGEPPPTRPLR